MIKKHVVIIPFNLPWEWSTDYTNQTAFVLSKKNTVVSYMWAESYSLKEYTKKRKLPTLIKRYAKNLYLFYPLFLIPGRRFPVIHFLNERMNVIFLKIFVGYLSLITKPVGKILWIFDPNNRFSIDLLGKGWKVIYDCVDYFQGTVSNPQQKAVIKKNEARLTKEADLVTANSMVLQKYLKTLRKDVYLVPQGFRVEDFKKKATQVQSIAMPKPIIGFAGAVNHRIDYDLLLPLAQRNPSWSFVVWGPVLEREKVTEKKWVKMQKLLKLPNVTTGFIKDRRKLPGIFSQFDITMIPYDMSQDFNLYCYPMKLFEFFYLGKPVVSTDILELRRFPDLVKIGKSYKEWEKIINGILVKSWPQKYRQTAKRLAMANSWVKKIESISSHIPQETSQ